MENISNAIKAVEAGLIHHQKGEIELALPFYDRALAMDPDQADAHNLCADIYHRKSNHLKGLYHSNQAIALSRNARFLNTRGMVLIGMNKFEEALSDLRAALKLEPELLEAHNNLSIVYRNLKQYKKAKDHAQIAIDGRPEFIEAWLSLAAAQQDAGEFSEAKIALKAILSLDGSNLLALANMAKVCYQMTNFEEAVTFAEQVIKKGYFALDIYFPLAHSLIELKRLPEAATHLQMGFKDARALAFSSLNNLLIQDVFFKTLHDCAQYLSTVIGDWRAALSIYEKCVEFAPDVAHAIWINMGTIYFQQHLLADAIRCNEEALKCNPNQIWALNNLGVFSIANENSKAAIAYFERALEIQPDFAASLGWLLREKGYICDWSNYDQLRTRVSALQQSGNTSPIAPFVSLSVYDDPSELLYWANLSAKELFNSSVTSAVFERPNFESISHKKIRIGYYSFDFRNHPVAHLTARLFELHDHNKFDIYAYSYGPDDGSAVRDRIKSNVKSFVDVKDLSVVDTARRIAEDEIDFLIDLTGNTLHTRSEVFALRPARIQAHWLGFVGTMGSDYYDYIIADSIVAPVEDEKFFSEKVLRLPSGMHIMDDTRVIESGHQTRVANGLPEIGIVFGCFCQTFKIQPEIFSSWMEILRAVPGSVLWLASGPAGAIDNLKRSAQAQQVDPGRIIIAERCGMDEYLSRFALIDLYLDTFPYTSGTVASDALHAGCPLLTLSGKTMVSRMAGSILTHAGLADLVCYSHEEYIAKAKYMYINQEVMEEKKRLILDKNVSGQLFSVKKNAKELEEVITNLVHKINSNG